MPVKIKRRSHRHLRRHRHTYMQMDQFVGTGIRGNEEMIEAGFRSIAAVAVVEWLFS
jgi:hypothetical protein